MRLMLVDDDGSVAGQSDEFSREEFDNLSPVGAFALINSID